MTLVQQLGRYAAALDLGDVPSDVRDYAKRLVLDALACVFSGLDSEPVTLVERAVEQLGGHAQATLLTSGRRTSAEHAALVNGVALRFPDFNDIYYGPAWAAHPSDSTAALIAVSEWRQRSGAEFLAAMVVTYEVQLAFSDLPAERNLWHRGWQHTAACAYASAAGVSRLLGLDAARAAHAISLSGARQNTFSEIRRGRIAMDKAWSEPMAASTSVFCAVLAEQGFTASATVLEGAYGLANAVAGGIDVSGVVPRAGEFRLPKVAIKPYPVQGMTPAIVQAALELRSEAGSDLGAIDSIRIIVPEEAVTKPSWDATKLAPDSKETADHSFHYCAAVALVAGEMTVKQFGAAWLSDPHVRALIGKTTLEARPDLTALYKRGARPAAMEITIGGRTLYREIPYPKGDPKNPMSWHDVQAKFHGAAKDRLGEGRVLEIVDRVTRLEDERSMAKLVQLLVPIAA